MSICNSLHIDLHLICSIVCCSLPCHASLNRTCIILDCASCHGYACVFTMLFVPFRVASHVSFGFVPELWGFVRLRPFVFFLDSFFFLAGFQARWSYPRNHYYLCYASLLALLLCHCYDAYHLLASLPNCHVKPLTHHCPSKPLIGYVTALLSPSYSVASCRWSLEAVPCWNIFYLLVGISLYYLVILMHLYTW